MGFAAEQEEQVDINEQISIFVQREWDGWRTAEVRLDDLEHVHWLRPSGAPCDLVHGYISCARIASGRIAHDCERSAGPHRLLVCVLKKHTLPSAYAELTRRADGHRKPVPRATVVSGRDP
jgi:hypothetical protein